MTETSPMSMCPMATMCKGMMGSQKSMLWMLIVPMAFIVIGMLIIFYPLILTWLVAIAMIMMGLAMLIFFNFMRGHGKSMHNASS